MPTLAASRLSFTPSLEYRNSISRLGRIFGNAGLFARTAFYSAIVVVFTLALYGATAEDSYAQNAEPVSALTVGSFQRQISDSLSVTTGGPGSSGSPGAPSHHYTRAISERINISTSILAPLQQTHADKGNALRAASHYSSGHVQRHDERLTLKNLGKIISPSTIGGTSYSSAVPPSFFNSLEIQSEMKEQQFLSELLNASRDDPMDDHLKLARSMAATAPLTTTTAAAAAAEVAMVTTGVSDNNQFYYETGLYGAYGIAMIGLSTYRWPSLRKAARPGAIVTRLAAFAEKNAKSVYIMTSIALGGAVFAAVFPVVETLADDGNGDFEGLSPGFWKTNAEQFNAVVWSQTGYAAGTRFDDVFGVVISGNPNLTLLDALNMLGGGSNALARHSTAALLNSAHPAINYPLGTADVITQVSDAINSGNNGTIESLKDQLDQYNNLGADLDQYGNSSSEHAARTTDDSVAISDAVSGSVKSSSSAPAESNSVAISAYKSGTGNSNQSIVRYREYNLSTQQWGDEVNVFNVGNPIRDLKILYSPVSEMRAIASLSRNGDLNIFVCDASCTEPSSWTRLGGDKIADVGSPGASRPWRFFDMEFENTSGRLVIVYDKSLREADDFYYRIYDGQSLSQEFGVNYNGQNNTREDLVYFDLASRPGSDELGLVFVDRSAKSTVAYIWNPENDNFRSDSKLVLATGIGSGSLDSQAAAIAYESKSGAAVVASAGEESHIVVSRWTGSSWSQPFSTDPNSEEDSATVFLSMKPDPSSDRIMLCQSDDQEYLTCMEINAGLLGSWNIMETDLDTDSTRAFDFAWDSSGSTGVLLFGAADDLLHYSRWDGSSWNTAFVSYDDEKNWISGATNFLGTDGVQSLFLVLNSENDIGSVRYDGQDLVVIGTATHTTQTSTTKTEALSIDLKSAGQTTTITTSVLSDSLVVSDLLVITLRVSGSASDHLTMTDAITTTILSAGRSVHDSIGISDGISSSVNWVMSDAVSVHDSMSSRVTKYLPDQLQLTDEVAVRVGRSLSDSIAVGSALSTIVHRTAPDDEISLDDAISFTVSRKTPMMETIDINDAIAKSVTKQVAETLGVDDSISVLISRQVSDDLNVNDGTSSSAATTRTANESLTVADSISKTAAKQPSDVMALSDSVSISLTRTLSDGIGISDEIEQPPMPLSDSISLTDSVAAAVAHGRTIADTLVVGDSIFRPPTPKDSVTFTDSISIGLHVTVQDSVGISDQLRNGWFVQIDDALYVASALADVSWTRTLGISEPLTLSSELCIPVLCVHNPSGLAMGIGLQDSLQLLLTPPPKMSEAVTVSDSIVADKTSITQLSDTARFADRVTTTVRIQPATPLPGSPLPPISVLIVDNKTGLSSPPSASVPINLNWSGDVAQLKELVKPVPHVINATVNEALLPQKTMVLPTYHMPNTPTDELPGKDVLLSVMAAKIPKDSPVMVPINVADTPEMKDRKKFTHSVVVEFTPAVDTTNFALVVTVLDEPPGIYQPPQADLKPLYLDVRWIGDFPGSEDPSVSEYYSDPPKFTFTVTDEWATEENAQRDENGIPFVSLSLLNESNGIWEDIPTITRPTAKENGVYTYIATLPHFSNYAITANKAAAAGSGDSVVGIGGGGGGGGTAEDGAEIEGLSSASALYTRQLIESIDIQEVTKNSAVTIIEELLKPKQVLVFMSDLVSIRSKPVALLPEIKVDQDITINMKLQEIRQADLPEPAVLIDILNDPSTDLPEKLAGLQLRLLTDLQTVIGVFVHPSALVEIEVQIRNTGEETRAFELEFKYSDAQGDVNRQTVVLQVDGGTTLTRHVKLTFTDLGPYLVAVEVRNLPEGDIAGFSTLTIEIPWLSMNLYTLVGAAGAIAGMSGISIAILVQKMAQGAAKTGAKAGAYNRKYGIRLFAKDEEEFKKDNHYDVLARLELRKVLPLGSQLQATFVLDVWSKKDGKEFIVTYRLADMSEKVVHESHVSVPAVPDLQSLSIVIPLDEPGQYTLYAEGRLEVGGDVLDRIKLEVQIDKQ